MDLWSLQSPHSAFVKTKGTALCYPRLISRILLYYQFKATQQIYNCITEAWGLFVVHPAMEMIARLEVMRLNLVCFWRCCCAHKVDSVGEEGNAFIFQAFRG